MLIKSFTVGHVSTNCYIVTDEKSLKCAVIDPGGESNTILDYIEDNKLKCCAVLLTHGHFDHTGGVKQICQQTGVKLYMSPYDVGKSVMELGFKFSPPQGSIMIKENDIIRVGTLEFKVLETPGHSEGGLTFVCGDALFTGDTLFKDSCGRTDLRFCNSQKLMQSLKKLYNLQGDYEVYPGHNEQTTLERERKFNYFMQSAIQE